MRPSRCQRSVSEEDGEEEEEVVAVGNDGKRRVRGKYSADAIRLASRYVSSGFIQALASSSLARSNSPEPRSFLFTIFGRPPLLYRSFSASFAALSPPLDPRYKQ